MNDRRRIEARQTGAVVRWALPLMLTLLLVIATLSMPGEGPSTEAVATEPTAQRAELPIGPLPAESEATQERVEVALESPEIQSALPRSPLLTVEVRDKRSGAQISGCEISVKRPRRPWTVSDSTADWSSTGWEAVMTGSTGRGGTCSLAGLSDGHYQVQLVSELFSAEPLEFKWHGLDTQLLLQATPLANITGLCVDARSQPLAGVRIGLRRRTQTISRSGAHGTVTAPDGRFLLKGVPVADESSDSLTAAHSSYTDRPVLEITLEPGMTTDVGRLVFNQPAALVTGQVRYPTGEPAVGMLEARRPNQWPAPQAYIGQDGRFMFRNLSPGNYDLHALAHCLEGRESIPITVPDGFLDLGILVAHLGQIELRGTVQDETGIPLPGASVRVGSLADATDEYGSFSLTFCDVRERRVRVLWQPPDEPSRISMAVVLSERASQHPIVLTLRRRGVLFHLVDRQTGQEIKGAEVSAEARIAGGSTRFSGHSPLREARIRIQDLEPGIWSFEIQVKGYRTWKRDERLGPEVRESERRFEVLLVRE